MKDIVKNDKKVINGWAMFDWANSSFTLVVSTAVFPPFYAAIAPDDVNIFGSMIDSNSLYSYAVSLSFVLLTHF